MAEWIKCSLGDIAEVTMGQSPKSEFYNTDGEGLPFMQGNRTFGRLYPIFDTYTTKITKVAEAGDIIMSVRAPVGDLNITPVKMCLGRGLCGIKAKNGERDFLYYLLKYNISNLLNKESGTVFGSVNKKDINGLEVNIPDSVSIQRKISEILRNFDDKIELNEKINENLFKQAQVLYQQSFPYTTSDYLPDGWRIGTVSEIIEIHDSKRIPLSGAKRNKMKRKIYPYYGAASLMDYVDEYIFDGKYLLLGEDGTVSDDAGFPILQYVWGKFWVNNHAHILTGKLGYNVESLYTLFSQTSVNSIITGAVQPKISQASLKSIRVVIPPEYFIEKFNEQIEPMFTLIRNNRDENKRLSALRDTLLPKLISGELNISKIKV